MNLEPENEEENILYCNGRMAFLRIHKAKDPCFEEGSKAQLAIDKLGVKELYLIRETITMTCGEPFLGRVKN